MVKRTASNSVLTRKAFIRSTEEFYDFSRKCLSKPQDENAKIYVTMPDALSSMLKKRTSIGTVQIVRMLNLFLKQEKYMLLEWART